MNETAKTAIDAASFAIVGSTLAAWLPPIAALLSIVWTSFRLYEMAIKKIKMKKEKKDA
jgi:hypothetical protein|tara:strand:- start:419 stop:595 length:177 start_codon:yes stop_codon:yes gene_type:complete